MRISDWSSDVCSSDLRRVAAIWADHSLILAESREICSAFYRLSDSTIIPIPRWQPASKARVSGLPARLSASIHHAGSARDGRTPPPLDAGHGATQIGRAHV